MPVELKRADSGRRFSADCDGSVTNGRFEGDPRGLLVGDAPSQSHLFSRAGEI
jgi:hypothetical protein